MATYIKTLKEDNGDIVYPQTSTDAVYTSGGETLETRISKYVTAEDVATSVQSFGTVTSGMIDDDAITTAKIDDDAVTTAKINDGAVTNAKIANNTITNSNVNFASFAVPVYIGRADFNKRTYNNSYLALENKSDLYAATGVSSQLTNSSLRWEFTLPAGTYVAQVYASLWVGANSWDYMLMEIQQNDAGFARSMGYRGSGSWGFVNAQGFSALTNGGYFSVRLNTNGNNFSDGNMSPRDSNVQIIIWKTS